MAFPDKTLKLSGGDYSLPSEWEADASTQFDATATHTLRCDAGLYTDTTALYMTGWAAAPTSGSRVNIIAAIGHEHGGVWDAGVVFEHNVFAQPVIRIDSDVPYVTIDNIQVRSLNNGSANGGIRILSGSTVQNCLVESTRNIGSGISLENNGALAYNCCARGHATGFHSAAFSTGDMYFCSAFYNVNWGFYNTFNSSGNMTNCVAVGNGGGFGQETVTQLGDNNASDDGTSPGANPQTAGSGDFTDYAGGDYSLAAGSNLIGAGVAIPGIVKDIAMGDRPSPPSIGAWEESGTAPPPERSKTLKASGGDYSLMSEWESGEQAGYEGNPGATELVCDAFVCTDLVTFDWATQSDAKVTIKPADGAHHGGVWGAGFVLKGSKGYGSVLNIGSAYVEGYGLEIENTITTPAGVALTLATTDDVDTWKEMLLTTSSSSGSGTNPGKQRLESSVIRSINNSSVGGIVVGGFNGAEIMNCTVVGFAWGWDRTSGNTVGALWNTVSYDNSTAGFRGTVTDWGNNAADDATAPGSNSQQNITDAAFVDFPGGDWSPNSGGVLYEAGFSVGVATDVTGAARVGTPSIGAWQEPVGAGPSPTPPTNLSAGGPYTAETGVATQLTGSYTPGTGTSHTFRWTTSGTGSFSSTTAQNPTYTASVDEVATLSFYVDADDTAEQGPATTSFTSSTATDEITFSGPIADQGGYVGASFSLDVTSYWSGTNKGSFTYALTSGTLPASLTLSSSGMISGNITEAISRTGLVITATDPVDGNKTAASNSFDFTTSEPPAGGGGIFSGGDAVVDVQHASTPVNQVYSGNVLVWQRAGELLRKDDPITDTTGFYVVPGGNCNLTTLNGELAASADVQTNNNYRYDTVPLDTPLPNAFHECFFDYEAQAETITGISVNIIDSETGQIITGGTPDPYSWDFTGLVGNRIAVGFIPGVPQFQVAIYVYHTSSPAISFSRTTNWLIRYGFN